MAGCASELQGLQARKALGAMYLGCAWVGCSGALAYVLCGLLGYAARVLCGLLGHVARVLCGLLRQVACVLCGLPVRAVWVGSSGVLRFVLTCTIIRPPPPATLRSP